MSEAVRFGSGHCCVCTGVCHHINGPWYCSAHDPRLTRPGIDFQVLPLVHISIKASGGRITEVSSSEQQTAECLTCGHVKPLAVWKGERPDIGVCRECRDLAATLRGPCSEACYCPRAVNP